MSKFKNNNTSEFKAMGNLAKGFTVIPNNILDDIPNLGDSAFTVLVKIFQYVNNPDHKISIRGLSSQLKFSKDKVTRALNKLIECGYIIREPITNGNLKCGYSYKVYSERVENTTISRSPNFQDTENKDTEKKDNIVEISTISRSPDFQDTENNDTKKENSKKENSKKENNISMYIYKQSIKDFSDLYQKNIGMINGLIGEWLIEVSETIPVDLFKRALEIATERNKCNMGYVKGILKQWNDNNIKSIEELEAFKLQTQSKSKEVHGNGKDGKREGSKCNKSDNRTTSAEVSEDEIRECERMLEKLGQGKN